MNLKIIGEGIDLSAEASTTAIDLGSETPFATGFTAVGVIHQLGNDADGVLDLETSEDNDTFTPVLTLTGEVPTVQGEVTLQRYVRATVSTAAATGIANVYLQI